MSESSDGDDMTFSSVGEDGGDAPLFDGPRADWNRWRGPRTINPPCKG
jgi:hypothetical protein